MLPLSALAADDYAKDVRMNREMAETWAFHRIAVIQAERGHVLEAKQTALQITDREGIGR